jgi:hypothetical protein
MIDRKQALAAAIALYETKLSVSDCASVEVRLILKHWVVNFSKRLPPNTVECPGSYCIDVDAETGEAEWFANM